MFALREWISLAAGKRAAQDYLAHVEEFLLSLSTASERGHLRSDIRPGLRITGFERRLTIAFAVFDDQVLVLRIFRRGRNWEADFGQ